MAQITGGPHRGHAAGDTDIEKQASQLASDVKYKVRKKMSGATHMNPAQVAAAYDAQLNRSKTAGTPPAVIALAKKKLMGAPKPAVRKEEFDNGVELATESIANALYKVFVEKSVPSIEEQNEYLKEVYSKVNRKGERLYHVIVTDKKTGNSYTRDATREKIAELRANPNIASVEMSERELDSDKEKTKGENTAKVKAGKGLDPVGKEDADPNNNGIDNDPSDKYIMKRRAAIGNAIASRKETQKEEFIHEGDTEDTNKSKKTNQIKPLGPNEKNTIIISPEVPGNGKKSSSFMQVSHYDMLGNPLSESEVRLNELIQERKMTKAEKAKEEKIGKKTKKKALPAMKAEYGDKKGEQIYYAWKRKQAMNENADCDYGTTPKLKKAEEPVDDARQMKTKVDLVKNKLRLMGLKMSYEPEGNELTEEPGDGYIGPARLGIKNPMASDATRAASDKKRQADAASGRSSEGGLIGRLQQRADATDQAMKMLRQSYEPEGEVIDEAKYGTAKGRKELAKKVRAGKDVGKKGAGFEEIVDKASPKVGKKRATKIAAAAMWKNLANSYEPEGEIVSEEESDKANDERLMRGGVGAGRGSSRPANAPTGPKKPASKVDAVALVLQQTRDKYGANAVTGGTRIRKPKPKPKA